MPDWSDPLVIAIVGAEAAVLGTALVGLLVFSIKKARHWTMEPKPSVVLTFSSTPANVGGHLHVHVQERPEDRFPRLMHGRLVFYRSDTGKKGAHTFADARRELAQHKANNPGQPADLEDFIRDLGIAGDARPQAVHWQQFVPPRGSIYVRVFLDGTNWTRVYAFRAKGAVVGTTLDVPMGRLWWNSPTMLARRFWWTLRRWIH